MPVPPVRHPSPTFQHASANFAYRSHLSPDLPPVPALQLAADSGSLPEWWSGKAIALDWFVERSRYIPLRLTHEERKFLRMLQAVVRARYVYPVACYGLDYLTAYVPQVFAHPSPPSLSHSLSNYTNKVDKPASTFKRPGMRAVLATNEIAGVLCALVSATDYAKGCELMSNGTFGTNEAFFQQVLELGRRHKIRNPEKMRSSYGSLMYILQDSQTTESLEYLGFSCVRPVHTVYELLEQRGGLGVLRDSRLAIATQEIIHTGKVRPARPFYATPRLLISFDFVIPTPSDSVQLISVPLSPRLSLTASRRPVTSSTTCGRARRRPSRICSRTTPVRSFPGKRSPWRSPPSGTTTTSCATTATRATR